MRWPPPMRLSSIAVVCCLATIFALGLKPVTDPDFWWHLATGRYMVIHHVIPRHDVFSVTAMSHRWITHEWLTELLFYGGWLLGGTRLLILATATVITCTFWLVYLAARERGAPPLLCAPIVLLAALASAHTWGTRPQMLSMLLTALFMLALTRMMVRQAGAPPYWLPLIMVLWVNLHGGFIFGLVLLALVVAGYAVQDVVAAVRTPVHEPSAPLDGDWDLPMSSVPRRRSRIHVDVARSITVVVVAGLGTLLNPNGLAGALYPISYLGNNASTRYISEWVSPDFHKVQYLLFEALVLLVLVGALASARRARLADILVLVPFTYLAFESVRNISLFAVIAAPIAAELMAALVPRALLHRRPRPLTRGKALLHTIIAAVIAVGVVASAAGKLGDAAQAKAVAATYPVGALRYIRDHGLPARGFDSYNWGGYLIWTLYPWRHVYVDGRPDMYGDRFMDQYIQAYNGSASWRTLFTTNSLCYALVEPNSGIAHALGADKAWVLSYHDNHAALFQVKRLPAACKP
jgi:hypothetical protein